MSDTNKPQRPDSMQAEKSLNEHGSISDLSRLNMLRVFGDNPENLRRLPTFIQVGPKVNTLKTIREIFTASEFSSDNPVYVDEDFFKRLLNESEVVPLSKLTLAEESEYRFVRSGNEEALFCLTGQGYLLQLVDSRV